MSRAKRAIKKLARRHHLHIEQGGDVGEITLTPHSVLISRDSQELVSARGAVEDTEALVALCEIGGGTNRITTTVIVVPLPFGLESTVFNKTAAALFGGILHHLHPDWSTYPDTEHQIALPLNSSEEQLAALRHACKHIPAKFSVEVVDQHLGLFTLPALEEEAEIETALRLAVEVRHLFVTA